MLSWTLETLDTYNSSHPVEEVQGVDGTKVDVVVAVALVKHVNRPISLVEDGLTG